MARSIQFNTEENGMETEMERRIADPLNWDGHAVYTLKICVNGRETVVTVMSECKPEAFYRVR